MYLAHFGLTMSPFGISPRLDFLYKSGAFEESMAHLVYGLDNSEAIVMITGAIGTGKTMAVQSFLSYLGDRYMSALVTNTCVDGRELLKLILDDLGAPFDAGADKSDLLIAFKKFLIEAGREGKRIVIVIDEAQNLARGVLEEIRLLTNLGQGDEQPIQIILVGQPELETAVQRPDLAQLKQRIRVHYKLAPLSRREVEEYIDHRMEVAGGKRGVFSGKALDHIFELSGGVPRVVNTLSTEALLSAFVAGRHKVEVTDLDEQAAPAGTVEPAEPIARVESASPAPAPTPAPVPQPKAAVTERRVDLAPRREPRPAQSAGAGRKRGARRTRRGRSAWLVAALVVAAVAALVVTGQVNGLWSRMPFAADGDGKQSDMAAESADLTGRNSTMESPAVAVADAVDDPRPAGVDPRAAAADSAKAPVMEMSPSTAPAPAPARPRTEAAVTTPTATQVAAGAPVAVAENGAAGATPAADGAHYIHVSSFRTANHAAAVAQEFTQGGLVATVQEQTVHGSLWHRVYLGPFGTHDEAVHQASRLRDAGTITYYKIVQLDTGEGL